MNRTIMANTRRMEAVMRPPTDGRDRRLIPRAGSALFALLAVVGCGSSSSDSTLTVDMPLHLEHHLDAAIVVGSEVPEDVREPVEWGAEELRSNWRRAYPFEFTSEPARLVPTEDALRLVFTEGNRDSDGDLVGGIYVDLAGWRKSDWGYIALQARATAGSWMGLGMNLKEPERDGLLAGWSRGFPLQSDGGTHTYLLRVDEITRGATDDPWSHLALWFAADRSGSVDILSVQAIPVEAEFAAEAVGVRSVTSGMEIRRSIFVHTPARLEYRVEIPAEARLDVGLGVLRGDAPVTFEITVTPEGGEAQSLAVETHDDPAGWTQRSVDLAHLAGQRVRLALGADAEPGTVALWTAPRLSGRMDAEWPNVIFYVIDGGGADFMSVYGYNRRNTPNMEWLAAQGAVFEHAYSNSGWTKPSTSSFLTSLHQSVLGASNLDSLPQNVVTMHEHFAGARYQTATITSNSWAGRLSSQGRGIDFLRDVGPEQYLDSNSSVGLHKDFWSWREAYPGQPYFVHFQTTDVHEPHLPVPPFAGLYVEPARRDSFEAWGERVWQVGGPGSSEIGVSHWWRSRLDSIGVDARTFFALQRDLYDETMAHQDYQLGRLVERLKASGEWENTLLIIAADHGHPAGSYSRFGRELLDPRPDESEGALFDSYRTRIPMIFVWPGHIQAGRRYSAPVSMIDVLPTLLDLAGLPPPQVMQGRSLAPLLRAEISEAEWEPRPVIFEQLQTDRRTGVSAGHIEVLDGRWGASLEIVPEGLDWETFHPPDPQRAARAHSDAGPRLLLYDVWNDPFATANVNDQHPELVEKYTAFLEAQWEAHRALATRFTP
ncbi:MAG: sulfatase, partial [Gemmatimonadetes bacterium]|nr:sulfatase [Gemmatimonadota bacterium]